MKWLAWTGILVLVLVLGAGLLLTYWFPSELVRQQLESRLSELLQGTVRIQSLSFNLLSGLEVRQLSFTRPDQPPLTLQHLTLDYSLAGLLKGRFTINDISIDQADIFLNLPELTKSTEPPPPPPSEPGTLPTLPVAIDLESFKIIDSNIGVLVSQDLTVHLSHVNFDSSGGMSSKKAHLDGTLQVEDVSMAYQDKHLQLPLVLSVDADIDLPTEHLELHHLMVASKPVLGLTLSGTVDKFLSQKSLALSLSETHLDLGALQTLGKDFLPPELAATAIQGRLSPSLNLSGSLPDSGFQGTMQAGLEGNDLELQLPHLGLTLGPADLSLLANNLDIRDNLPTKGEVTTTFSTHRLAYQAYGVQDLDVSLESRYDQAGPFSGNVKISGRAALPDEWLGGPVVLPVALTLDSNGNYQTKNITVRNLAIDMRPYGSMAVQGAVAPRAGNQSMDASLQVRLLPHIPALLALLPKDRLQGLVLQKEKGTDSLMLQATGVLHPDFRPAEGKATAALKLSPFHLKRSPFGAEGTLNQLTILLSSGYREETGTVQGTVGFSTNLSGVGLSDMIGLGSGHVVLKSTFQGSLSPAYELIGLRSHDQLQVTLGNITYRDPSLTATIPALKLTSRTKEDVLQQDVLVESLRLTSDRILDMNLAARLKQDTQQFDVDLQVPLLHVGNLLPHLSGPLMEGIEGMNPQGRVSLALRAAGTVPQDSDFDNYSLPLGINSKILLRDLEGAVAGYRIEKGNGTIHMAYSPEARPQTQFTTDVTIDRIYLPDALPLSELSGTSLRVHLISPDLNEVQVKPVRLTSKGLELDLNGAVVGLREFLSSDSTPGALLAKLFAQLETRLRVDLGPFKEALRPLGVQGQGDILANLSLLKKERGSLETSMEIGTKGLTVNQNGRAVQNMNGGIRFRKILFWKPDGLAPLPTSPFQPSDRISELKSFARKGQTITIERLQVGELTVQNFSTNLEFEQQSLKLQNLAMNLLGGGIGGKVIIAASRPLQVSAGLEIANLDANQLITSGAKIQGDSQIAATLGLSTPLQETTGAVDLSRLECNLQITHIGKEALDRFLVFLDPEGLNPTLSNARAQLKLANPSRVTIDIARGLLNLTIRFQGSFIPTFTLNRVPVAKMKSIEKMTAALPDWEGLKKVLDIIAAESYSFTPEGEIVFH